MGQKSLRTQAFLQVTPVDDRAAKAVAGLLRDTDPAHVGSFRAAFPDLNFEGTADLIAEGDYVVGQWEGGGTHNGPAFDDFLVGGLPAATGRKMHFSGTTVLKVIDGKIVEERGLDDGVTALTQLGLIKIDTTLGGA